MSRARRLGCDVRVSDSTTFQASARSRQVLWGVVLALAVGGCGRNDLTQVPPPPPPPPVASVEVSPTSATLDSGQTLSLNATPKDGGGHAVPGLPVTWMSDDTQIATVTPAGIVTALTGGTATVTATSDDVRGRAEIAVIAPLPPPGVSCLTQPGAVLTVSGVQTSALVDTSLALNAKIAASTAQFLTSENIPIRVGGNAGLCFSAGGVMGTLPPATPWIRMHKTYGLVPYARSFRLERLRVFDYGMGVSMDAAGDASWSLRDVYFTYIRDDCVENTFLNSGTIENSLFDGCYEAFSSRPYTTPPPDGSNNLVVVRNSLVRLQDMDQGYLRPGHGGFFKWYPAAPKVSLYHTVFRVDSPNIENSVLVPLPDQLQDCVGNVMIWLGSGPFPEPLPARAGCFTLLTGAEGLQYWNDAVARWKAEHPAMSADLGPPIVSLYSPADSTTLTGVVTLTATAVDDQAVAGVQFALNGQNIGAEVMTESPATKFTLQWDSHAVANGTYALTARVRDGVGQATTSAGVTVTISN